MPTATATEESIRKKHLPRSTPMKGKREGGQANVYETKKEVIRIAEGELGEEFAEIQERIRKDVDPEGERFVEVTRFGEERGYSWQVMKKLKPYPKSHVFTPKQKGYIRDSILLLYINDIMGHGDIKSDNVMFTRNRKNQPILIDIDTVLIDKDTKEHVINDNIKLDLDEIDKL
jgi:hypothetical protein